VLAGMEIEPTDNSEIYEQYGNYRSHEVGDWAYLSDPMFDEYTVFGKILAVSGRYQKGESFLEFATHTVTPKIYNQVIQKVGTVFGLRTYVTVSPKLYVFTHVS